MFYTYLWLREDGTPYYVGKGKNNRGFTNYNHIVNKPVDKERIITQEWPNEELAFEGEKILITYYGRLDLCTGCLRNRTNGGEGPSGYKMSKEAKQKLSIGRLGMKFSEEHKRNISLAKQKWANSLEGRNSLSIAAKKSTIGRNMSLLGKQGAKSRWKDK